jgi:hypothetical protein
LDDRPIGEDTAEPPVPPGLGEPTTGLRAFADFLRIDRDLVAAAAQASPSAGGSPGASELARWIATLPSSEKDRLLARIAAGEEPQPRTTLLRGFHEANIEERTIATRSRTVAELLAAAQRRAEKHDRRERERAERKRGRREREDAKTMDRRLAELAGRQEETWDRVERLVDFKQADAYDDAVRLLRDLRELAAREDRVDDVDERIRALGQEHSRKWSFVERLRDAGLIPPR